VTYNRSVTPKRQYPEKDGRMSRASENDWQNRGCKCHTPVTAQKPTREHLLFWNLSVLNHLPLKALCTSEQHSMRRQARTEISNGIKHEELHSPCRPPRHIFVPCLPSSLPSASRNRCTSASTRKPVPQATLPCHCLLVRLVSTSALFANNTSHDLEQCCTP
jgi:hypothetical protein